MSEPSRMPRYEIRNDGVGAYAVFYCDQCEREYRSKPNVGGAIANDLGRNVASDFLRRLPIFGDAAADSLLGEDARYSVSMSAAQLESAWGQVKAYFRECPTCRQILCLSDFDEKSGYCREDSPRANEIAEAEAEQAASVVKGIANVFGLGDAIAKMNEAAEEAAKGTARCPKDGTLAAAGTKFCPNCGGAMIQPAAKAAAADACPKCGADTKGAKFCPECGNKVVRAAPSACPSCGAEAKGAKFCPECGTRLVA